MNDLQKILGIGPDVLENFILDSFIISLQSEEEFPYEVQRVAKNAFEISTENDSEKILGIKPRPGEETLLFRIEKIGSKFFCYDGVDRDKYRPYTVQSTLKMNVLYNLLCAHEQNKVVMANHPVSKIGLDILNSNPFKEKVEKPKAEPNPAPYGYCPVCGKPGVERERCPNGQIFCENGHSWRILVR